MIFPSAQNKVTAKQGLDPKSLFHRLILFSLDHDRREKEKE